MQKWYKAISIFNIISPTLNASPPALTIKPNIKEIRNKVNKLLIVAVKHNNSIIIIQ